MYLINLLNEDASVENQNNMLLNEAYESKPINVKYNPSCDTTIFQTILQEAEVPNRNNRIYLKKAIQDALNREFIREKIRRKTWYGENGHPFEKNDARRQTYLDREKVAHIVLDYWWEGNLLWGTIETTATRAGRDFQGLIRQGCGVSFSMRGLGGHSYKNENGIEVVDKDLFIYCYDNVDFPSHDKAYIQNILKEDLDYRCNKDNYVLQESGIFLNESSNSIITPDSEDNLRELIEGCVDNKVRDKYRAIYNESLSRQDVDKFLLSL